MLRPTLATAAALILLAQPVHAQEDFFSEFHFNKLEFKFWPAGVENRQESDGVGSAITVHVDRVLIEADSAWELRNCIDGDSGVCTYDIPGGNQDGTVTADEVESFEQFAKIGIKSRVPRVGKFAEMLQQNVSVDGMQGKTAVITRVDFQGAEGSVESDADVIAYVDAKVTYDNDPKAKTHTIRIDDLPLKSELFLYDSVLWVAGVPKWSFDTKATTPDGAKPRVTAEGYYSNQDTFESLAATGMEIQVKEGGAKKSPGVGFAALVGVVALAAVALRRRT